MRLYSVSVLVALGAFFGGASAFAIGDAGCGLGSLIMSRNTKVSQTFAETTNGTLSSQFFGITSGTSGCSASEFVESDQKAAVYAEANYPTLMIDMARGQGETLAAFARLMGCQDGAISALGAVTKANYGTLYPTPTTEPAQMVSTLRGQIAREKMLSSSCAVPGQV